MMRGAPLLLVTALAACTVLTPLDLAFLATDSGADDDAPGCLVTGAHELPHQCRDGCDNDGDGLVDCADEEDCRLYCCAVIGAEDLACNDQCDNDDPPNGKIDCEDHACASQDICQPAPPPETECGEQGGGLSEVDFCCSNGEDDDGDGEVDCRDSDCTRSELCCETASSFTDPVGGGFDAVYWEPFGGRIAAPEFGDVEGQSWLLDWRSGELLGGVATAEPIDLSFGISVEFTAEVVAAEACMAPEDCRSFTGIALGPDRAPRGQTDPARHLSVLVTSSNHVAVVRGGRVLHRIGIEPSPNPDEVVPMVRRIRLDIMPATSEGGVNGFRMQLRVPHGREVCHANGTSIGCPPAEVWVSEELVLLADDNVLDGGGRGVHVMVIGRGAGVRLSDSAAAGGTVKVQVRNCTNPAAWQPGLRRSTVSSSVLCWAVGALGSPSVIQTTSGYAMVLHGTTRLPVPSDYGINNYSLGWLAASSLDSDWRDQQPSDNIQRWPIDTRYDLSCTGPREWVGTECVRVPPGGHPVDPPEGCREARSHRSPHAARGLELQYAVFYSESLAPAARLYGLRVGEFRSDTWAWFELEEAERRLSPSELPLPAASLHYRSVRDPMALCASLEDGGASCGQFAVLAVAEAAGAADSWAGDAIVAIPYDHRRGGGFSPASAVVLLPFDDGPLAGRSLSDPFALWEPDTGRLFLWVTTDSSQLDLLVASCPECETADEVFAQGELELFEGSPVLAREDLETLLRSPDGDSWVDCSGGCEIGGVAALRSPGAAQDVLNLWVEVVERPVGGELASWGVHHLVQPFGLLRPSSR